MQYQIELSSFPWFDCRGVKRQFWPVEQGPNLVTHRSGPSPAGSGAAPGVLLYLVCYPSVSDVPGQSNSYSAADCSVTVINGQLVTVLWYYVSSWPTQHVFPAELHGVSWQFLNLPGAHRNSYLWWLYGCPAELPCLIWMALSACRSTRAKGAPAAC